MIVGFRSLPALGIHRLQRAINKMFDWSKLKAFADDKININEEQKVVLGTGRKNCGKRRKCCKPAFSHFPTMFLKGFFSPGLSIVAVCAKG